jgi:hypothetical protein
VPPLCKRFCLGSSMTREIVPVYHSKYQFKCLLVPSRFARPFPRARCQHMARWQRHSLPQHVQWARCVAWGGKTSSISSRWQQSGTCSSVFLAGHTGCIMPRVGMNPTWTCSSAVLLGRLRAVNASCSLRTAHCSLQRFSSSAFTLQCQVQCMSPALKQVLVCLLLACSVRLLLCRPCAATRLRLQCPATGWWPPTWTLAASTAAG